MSSLSCGVPVAGAHPQRPLAGASDPFPGHPTTTGVFDPVFDYTLEVDDPLVENQLGWEQVDEEEEKLPLLRLFLWSGSHRVRYRKDPRAYFILLRRWLSSSLPLWVGTLSLLQLTSADVKQLLTLMGRDMGLNATQEACPEPASSVLSRRWLCG